MRIKSFIERLLLWITTFCVEKLGPWIRRLFAANAVWDEEDEDESEGSGCQP